jgi:hypothetical protein
MQVWRTVESIITVEGKGGIPRLLMTLGCGHAVNLPIDYFWHRKILTNRLGKSVFRCPKCEELAKRPPTPEPQGGGAA